MENYIASVLNVMRKGWKLITSFDLEDLDVSIKWDNSPVTQVDMEVSDFLRQELPKILQGDVYSEEHACDLSNSKIARFIDPIDWTKNFIRWDWLCNILVWCADRSWVFLWCVYFPYSWSYAIAQKWFGTYVSEDWSPQEKIESYWWGNCVISKSNTINGAILDRFKKHWDSWKQVHLYRPSWLAYYKAITAWSEEMIFSGWYGYELTSLAWLFVNSPYVLTVWSKNFDPFSTPDKINSEILLSFKS